MPRRGKVAINDAEELRREVADLTERNQRSEEVIEQLRVAENNARIQAENENKRADHAERQLVEIHEAFEGEKLRPKGREQSVGRGRGHGARVARGPSS